MKNLITNLVFLWAFLYFTDSNAQAPVISSFSPSQGAVGTLVSISGTGLNTPESVQIGGKAALVIASSATSITAYVMPGAVAGLISVKNSFGSSNSTSQFTLLNTPYPNTQQGPKLVGGGSIGEGGLGRSAAISADGNTAIVGGSSDNAQQGAAWIYVRNNGIWTQQGPKLVGSGNVGPAHQGKSVGISADGNTVVIGGNNDNKGMGAIWIFTRKNGIWTQQGDKLVGTDTDATFLPVSQGFSVGMSADGNTVIVGGPYDSSSRGAAWVFIRTGNVWTQDGGKLFDDTNVNGSQGQGISVGLSADGNTAIVGAPLENSQEGAAYVFVKSSSTWDRQPKKLAITDYVSTKWQGISVALSADGANAIVGGSVDGNARGAAWVFQKNGAEWIRKGLKMVGTGSSADAAQGWSVSISADGNTSLVGGYKDNWTNGAVWVYTWTDSKWLQRGPKLTGTGSKGLANQGHSLALSADGSTAIIAGNIDNNLQGASWIFTTGPAISITLNEYSSLFCKGLTETRFSYTATEGDPDLYSIEWDAEGLAAGLTNVNDQPLPPGSILVKLPALLADGVYNGALRVKNTRTGESSTGSIFTLVIPELPKISPITGAGSLAVGSTSKLVSATANGVWTSSSNAIATVNASSGQVSALAEGAVTITYTVTNAAGCSNSESFNLLVLSASSLQSISFPPIPVRIYGDADFPPGAVHANPSSTMVYMSSDSQVASITVTGQIKIRGVGLTLITASQSDNRAINASQILTVKPRDLSITVNDQTRSYGIPNPELTAVYNGFVPGEGVSVLEKLPVISTSASISSSPGIYPIVASAALAANYSISYVDGKLLISKADQAMDFEPIPNKKLSELSFRLNATVNSGLPVTFTSNAPAIASIIPPDQVSINSSGKVIIEASQAGNENYNPVTVFREFSIFSDFFTLNANTFTPNGDGINDQWTLPGLDADNTAMVQVYNRYGKLVFESMAYTKAWDGYFQGEVLPQGTYYYKISSRAGKQVLSGAVTLIY
ncbi:gliding motility-associated C-terminal domain-containing protein [Daejeonella rubra]|uniref:Gliding motility-associated C-terminal domain-containing protein n=1 Tax=Daejeonella rubra TaxID=990371 RepID=A0A1G9TRN6_9SPHI|nr:gliding motility-associated C-terminal domain-containing protein [Daejeonella rubra]SDM50281.1 gliding motility-associated C-terminal domain-containing protein [Daejeonella rubra]